MDGMNNNDGFREPTNEDGSGRLEKAAEQAREKLGEAKEGLAAGASGVAEFTRSAASATRERADHVAGIVKEAKPDPAVRSRVGDRTERSLERASGAVTGAAPAIGRGAERAAEKVGQALHGIAHPLGAVVGAIAGTLGGWWKKAEEEPYELPEAEEQACRTHFASVPVMPPGMTYDLARTGYGLGYIASRNPDYRDRGFDEVEPDLRRGFGGADPADYDSLRDFTRYGYERGTGGAL